MKSSVAKAMADKVVGLDGLEPSTSRLSVVCSSQLSYRPLNEVEVEVKVEYFNTILKPTGAC